MHRNQCMLLRRLFIVPQFQFKDFGLFHLCDETDRVGLVPIVAAARSDNAADEVQDKGAVDAARRRGPVVAEAACAVDVRIAIAAIAMAGSREKDYACILQSLEVIICICV